MNDIEFANDISKFLDAWKYRIANRPANICSQRKSRVYSRVKRSGDRGRVLRAVHRVTKTYEYSDDEEYRCNGEFRYGDSPCNQSIVETIINSVIHETAAAELQEEVMPPVEDLVDEYTDSIPLAQVMSPIHHRYVCEPIDVDNANIDNANIAVVDLDGANANSGSGCEGCELGSSSEWGFSQYVLRVPMDMETLSKMYYIAPNQ